MRSLLLLATALLASAATAQTTYFDVFGCTNFTSRGDTGPNAGEILMKMPDTHIQGLGHDATGTGTNLVGFQYYMQDQNAATVEQYYLIVRGDNAGQPDYTGGSGGSTTPPPILRAGPLNSPGGSGTLAWIVTATLNTPTTLLPLCSTYYHGSEVQAANWTADGISWHIGTYYLTNGVSIGDNPAPNAPKLSWNVNYNSQAVTTPGSPRCIRFALGLTSACLNMGNVDPTAPTTNCVVSQNNRSWGAGGMWPQSNIGTREDGLDFRVRDARSANGVYAVFIGADIGCPGIPLPGLADGALYLNPGALTTIGSGLLDGSGVGIGTVLPPNSGVTGAIINRTVSFQGFVIGPAFTLPGKLTNRAGTTYLP